MLGLVFCEFSDFVEEAFGEAALDEILSLDGLASGGVYTRVGVYPHQEMFALVKGAAAQAGLPATEILVRFGRHLAGRFTEGFPEMFAAAPTLIELLASVDQKIHVEVRKLYPDAELPRFDVRSMSADQIELEYTSHCRLEHLAQGLIEGVAAHYGVAADIEMTPGAEFGETSVLFAIRARALAA